MCWWDNRGAQIPLVIYDVNKKPYHQFSALNHQNQGFPKGYKNHENCVLTKIFHLHCKKTSGFEDPQTIKKLFLNF